MIDVVYSQENESTKEVNVTSFFVLILNIINSLIVQRRSSANFS